MTARFYRDIEGVWHHQFDEARDAHGRWTIGAGRSASDIEDHHKVADVVSGLEGAVQDAPDKLKPILQGELTHQQERLGRMAGRLDEGKEPWQMTKDEWQHKMADKHDVSIEQARLAGMVGSLNPGKITEGGLRDIVSARLADMVPDEMRGGTKRPMLNDKGREIANGHIREVADAIRSGKPVPALVMKDYPHFANGPLSEQVAALKEESGGNK